MKTCSICWEKKKLYPICQQNHEYCRACIKKYIKMYMGYPDWSQKCMSNNCTNEINIHKIKSIDFKIHKQLTRLNNWMPIQQCPKPGCSGFCYDFKCDKCHNKICNKCYHSHNYEENCFNIAPSELKSRITKAKCGKRCPKCKSWYIKAGGCDDMTCAKCKTNFDESTMDIDNDENYTLEDIGIYIPRPILITIFIISCIIMIITIYHDIYTILVDKNSVKIYCKEYFNETGLEENCKKYLITYPIYYLKSLL